MPSPGAVFRQWKHDFDRDVPKVKNYFFIISFFSHCPAVLNCSAFNKKPVLYPPGKISSSED